jgi:hypothetical protein
MGAYTVGTLLGLRSCSDRPWAARGFQKVGAQPSPELGVHPKSFFSRVFRTAPKRINWDTNGPKPYEFQCIWDTNGPKPHESQCPWTSEDSRSGGAPNTPGQGPFEFPAWPPGFQTVFGELPEARIRQAIRSRRRRLRMASRIRASGSSPNTVRNAGGQSENSNGLWPGVFGAPAIEASAVSTGRGFDREHTQEASRGPGMANRWLWRASQGPPDIPGPGQKT